MDNLKRKLILVLAAVVLLSAAGCASTSLNGSGAGSQPIPTTTVSTAPTNPTVPADTFDYAKYGTTKQEAEAQQEKFGKVSTELDICDFSLENVCVIVYPFANNYAYTPADFQEIGCTGISINVPPSGTGDPDRFLVLTLSDQTEQGVLDAIDILIQRPDVYSAQPNYKENHHSPQIDLDLTEEIKQTIGAAWLTENNAQLDWDAKNNVGESCVIYLAAYNGKYAFITVGDRPAAGEEFTYKIGPYTFVYNCPFDVIVCVDGQLATLSLAYEQDLLTADETMSVILGLTNYLALQK